MPWNPSSGLPAPTEFEDILYGDLDNELGAEYEVFDEEEEPEAIDLDGEFPDMETDSYLNSETYSDAMPPALSGSAMELQPDLESENYSDTLPPAQPGSSIELQPDISSMDVVIDSAAPPQSWQHQPESCPPVLIVVPPDQDSENVDDQGFMPDVHEIYRSEPAGVAELHIRRGREGRVRGRRQVGRGGGRGALRGGSRRARGARAASMGAHTWTRGDPLIQVCVTDDDVPASLRSMVMDLLANRQERRVREAATRQRLPERIAEEGNEFFDVEDGVAGDEGLDGINTNFEWKSMETFRAQKETFVPERTGSVINHTTIYDAFRAFWDDTILQDIVQETNKYARTIASEGFQSAWVDTNPHEILVLFAFWMMLAIIRMPTLKSCFSTNNLLSTEIFKSMFTQHRYVALSRALHFADNAAKPVGASRLYCFGRVLDHLNKKFQDSYIPSQNICIDESLTLWKGLLLFKQYIRSKAQRFGIKTFELCDSATGYLWSFLVYTGKEPNATPSLLLKSTSVVLELCRPLFNKGYCLFMDNWFNSPALARFLKSKKTDCVGTLRSTRKGVPELLQVANLSRGQFIARHSGDVCVLAWQDKKRVLSISTCHGVDIGSVVTGRGNHQSTQWKPQLILDYNKNMGGVDRKDQMLEPYLIERKRCKKWYLKLFKRLLNVSILNARILVESSTGQHNDHLATRLCLVQSILNKHKSLVPQERAHARVSHSQPTLARLNSAHVHWPVRITQGTAPSDAGRHTRLRCSLCFRNGRKNIRTQFKCEHCDVALCLDCFKNYHV